MGWSIRRKDGSGTGGASITEGGLATFPANSTSNDIIYVVSYQQSNACPVFTTEHTVLKKNGPTPTPSTNSAYISASRTRIPFSNTFDITFCGYDGNEPVTGSNVTLTIDKSNIVAFQSSGTTAGRYVYTYLNFPSFAINVENITFTCKYTKDGQTYSTSLTVTAYGAGVVYLIPNKTDFEKDGGIVAIETNCSDSLSMNCSTSSCNWVHGHQGTTETNRVYNIDANNSTNVRTCTFSCGSDGESVTITQEGSEVEPQTYVTPSPERMSKATSTLKITKNETGVICGIITAETTVRDSRTNDILSSTVNSYGNDSYYAIATNTDNFIRQVKFKLTKGDDVKYLIVYQDYQ